MQHHNVEISNLKTNPQFQTVLREYTEIAANSGIVQLLNVCAETGVITVFIQDTLVCPHGNMFPKVNEYTFCMDDPDVMEKLITDMHRLMSACNEDDFVSVYLH
ncbi:hypothetical protein [Algicola sagamiensis]|uniref:hypothetical protein n=1 Tax=Algicola sagamiensis TaxID=163869 RepID=UPI00037F24DD|nr:hypothetical protein [Algicola sagamiensis]